MFTSSLRLLLLLSFILFLFLLTLRLDTGARQLQARARPLLLAAQPLRYSRAQEEAEEKVKLIRPVGIGCEIEEIKQKLPTGGTSFYQADQVTNRCLLQEGRRLRSG